MREYSAEIDACLQKVLTLLTFIITWLEPVSNHCKEIADINGTNFVSIWIILKQLFSFQAPQQMWLIVNFMPVWIPAIPKHR